MNYMAKKVLLGLIAIGAVLSFATVSFALTDDEQVLKLNERGLKEFKNNKLDEAIESWDKAAELAEKGDVSPDLIAEVFNNYGYGRYMQGKKSYYLAEEYLLKSMRFAPGRWSVYLNLGDLYFDVGGYDRARDMYKTLLGIKPDYRKRKKILNRIKDVEEGTLREKNICHRYGNDNTFRIKCNVPYIPRPPEYYLNHIGEYIDLRLLGIELNNGEVFKLQKAVELPDGKSVIDLIASNFKIVLIEDENDLYWPLLVAHSYGIEPTSIFNSINKGETILSTVTYYSRYYDSSLLYKYDASTNSFVQLGTNIGIRVNPQKDMSLDCDYQTDYSCEEDTVNTSYKCLFFDARTCWKPQEGCIAGHITYSYTFEDGDEIVIDTQKEKDCKGGAAKYYMRKLEKNEKF